MTTIILPMTTVPSESGLLRLAIAKGLLRWEDLDAVAERLPDDDGGTGVEFLDNAIAEAEGHRVMDGYRPARIPQGPWQPSGHQGRHVISRSSGGFLPELTFQWSTTPENKSIT